MDDEEFNLEIARAGQQLSKSFTPLRTRRRSKDIFPKKLDLECSPNLPIENR